MKPKLLNASPFSFDLVFTNDPLLGPSAHIVLRCCSRDEDGTTYLTPECKTPEEWNYEKTRLQSELDILHNEGTRRFIESINGRKSKRRKKL